MRRLFVLTLTALILSVGCAKKDVEQPPTGNGKSPVSTPEQVSVDVAKEHELVVRPAPPIPKGGKDPEPLNVRYTLTAKHAGKLLLRVREPLLVTDPPPWANATAPLESDGLAQRVLDLSKEDFATPLAIEARVVHPRAPEEMVRVHLTLHRGDKAEPWSVFYQCRPAMKTVRSNWRSSRPDRDRGAVIDSGETIWLWSYNFGGDTTGVQVPLTEEGMQMILIELGLKSNPDLTP